MILIKKFKLNIKNKAESMIIGQDVMVVKAKDIFFKNILRKNNQGLSYPLIDLIFKKLGIPGDIQLKQISPQKLEQLTVLLNNLPYSKRNAFIQDNILLHQRLNTFRGHRHRKGYPCRGQRTCSNATNAKKMKNLIQSLKRYLR